MNSPYNIYHWLSAEEQDILILRNDELAMDEIKQMELSHIIISPGPMAVGALTERESVGRILRHIGEPDYASKISPVRGLPEFEYDQTVNW